MIKDDERLKKVIKTFSKRVVMPVDDLIDEVFGYQKTKRPPSIDGIRKLAEYNQKQSANRSRVAAIKMRILREMMEYRGAVMVLDDYLRSKYQNHLGTFNVKTQDAMIAAALAPITKNLSPLENALDLIDVCLEDFDKAGMSANTTSKLLEQGDRA